MTIAQYLEAAGLGLAAGTVGGLAGIGGSVIMLPGLALFMGFHGPDHNEQHLYMAAAMAVNVLVALPAARRHAKSGAVRGDLVVVLIPAMVIAIIAGVLVSDRLNGAILRLLLAGYIMAYCAVNIVRLVRARPESEEGKERIGVPLLVGIGGGAGFAAGLLGIGGGAVIVPALQLAGRVRLRHAIGTSTAAMIASALVGAILKFSTLSKHGLSWTQAALLAAAMAPGAVLGGTFGAELAHRLPLKAVRLAISCLLMIVAVRLAMPR